MNQDGIRVLVVDDEPGVCAGLNILLTHEGYRVETAENGRTALALAERQPPDVVVSDLKMPMMDGFELLGSLHARFEGLPVIVVTACDDMASAVRALRAGAADYLSKPVDFGELQNALARATASHSRADVMVSRQRPVPYDHGGFEGLLGDSPPMRRVYKLASQAAPARATVLLTGESGTGKGELARAIHARSPRANGPFVTLHCTALAETLLESELFGHEKGSFTGADRRRVGRFELAHGGTLFLDEIGEVPPALQLKLLRVLQERTFERVGGNEAITVDVRLIAATNRDLAREVAERRFREDLYYRLDVLRIEMPPLRVRGDDVVTLARHFLARYAAENQKGIEGFTDAAVAGLLAHPWPGNVRELENAIERAVVLAEHPWIDADDLPFATVTAARQVLRVPGATMAQIERHAILATVEAANGSTTKAAEMLGLSVRTIQYRLREYGSARERPCARGGPWNAPDPALPSGTVGPGPRRPARSSR